jgi:hydrogenase maturation factor HypF (carbamoyltransferase family)
MKITEKKVGNVTVINVDPGNTVLCDLCNEDYTNSDEKGGFLFSGKAVCPKCAPKFMKSVKLYNEERFIVSEARSNETFRDFVYRIRRREY